MDQAELLERCREGDELAWEMLVRQQQGRVCSIAYSYVGEQDEALDLAQDIFVRLYKSLGYKQVNVWPAYYFDKEDGLVFERSRS